MHGIPGTLTQPRAAELALEIAAYDPLAAELALEVAAGRVQPAAPHLSAPEPFVLARLLAVIALASLVLWLA